MMVSSGRPITVLPLSLNSIGIIASCWVVTRSICYPTSCGKYFITVNAGLGAACPRPQIEASIMA